MELGLKNKKAIIALALPIILLGIALVFFLMPKDLPQNSTPPAPIYVAIAQKKDVPEDIKTVGEVESFATVEIKSRVEGELTEIFFEEGAYVNAGDPLFTIDPRPFQAKVDEAKAILQRDKATLNKAREDLRRYSALIKQEAISREEFEQAQATAQALEATVRSNEATLTNAQLQLEYSNIKSPISGRTGRILVRPGNIVKANADTPLLVIEQMQPVRVTFPVPERYLNQIIERKKKEDLFVLAKSPQSTQAAQSTQPTQMAELAQSAQSAQAGQEGALGVLSFVDNSVNAPTGTILLKAIFENQDEKLWPGQFVDVKLHLDVMQGAITIPSKAIQQGQKGPYVYVVNSQKNGEENQDVVEMRLVETGYMTEDETVILKGLVEGETVVTKGQLRLTPGAKVKILQEN